MQEVDAYRNGQQEMCCVNSPMNVKYYINIGMKLCVTDTGMGFRVCGYNEYYNYVLY